MVLGLCGPVTRLANADETFAVLFSGGVSPASNNSYYYSSMLNAFNIFSGLYGMNNVYVVYADGQTNTPDQSNGNKSPFPGVPANQLYAATPQNLEALITETIPIAANAGAEGNKTPYSFVFYSFDHGSPQTDDSTTDVQLNGWGNNVVVTNQQLSSWVTTMDQNSDPIAELFDFNECYSKGMATGANGVLATGSDVFATWAASHCSFGSGFSDAFLEAIQSGLTSTSAIGNYAVQNDIYGPNGGTYKNYEDPGYAGYNFNILTNQQVPEPSAPLVLAMFLLMFVGFVGARSAQNRLVAKVRPSSDLDAKALTPGHKTKSPPARLAAGARTPRLPITQLLRNIGPHCNEILLAFN